MEICKAPTLQLKALNKHGITQIMYTQMENVISNNVYKKKERKFSVLNHIFSRMVTFLMENSLYVQDIIFRLICIM